MILLTPEVQADIRRLRENAELHPVDHARYLRTAEGKEKPVGDNADFVCSIPLFVRCVYSHDEAAPGRWYRHLSVSVGRPGRRIHPGALQMLLTEFGFRLPLGSSELLVYEEECMNAVNVMEPLGGAA